MLKNIGMFPDKKATLTNIAFLLFYISLKNKRSYCAILL